MATAGLVHRPPHRLSAQGGLTGGAVMQETENIDLPVTTLKVGSIAWQALCCRESKLIYGMYEGWGPECHSRQY